jgi:hypothetical protein
MKSHTINLIVKSGAPSNHYYSGYSQVYWQSRQFFNGKKSDISTYS